MKYFFSKPKKNIKNQCSCIIFLYPLLTKEQNLILSLSSLLFCVGNGPRHWRLSHAAKTAKSKNWAILMMVHLCRNFFSFVYTIYIQPDRLIFKLILCSLFNASSPAVPHISLCRKMLGLNLRLMQYFLHWQSDAPLAYRSHTIRESTNWISTHIFWRHESLHHSAFWDFWLFRYNLSAKTWTSLCIIQL